MTRSRFWISAGLLIAAMSAVQISSMLGETQTWDEGIHLAAGYRYLTSGDYTMNSEHPVLMKLLAALPLLPLQLKFEPAWLKLDEASAGFQFLYFNTADPDLILALARSVTVAMSLAFAAWIAIWTRRHFGMTAALLALGLFAFDPNLIAHGRYVTTDLAVAFFTFLAATLWIDCLILDQPPLWRVLLAGAALGAAVSSKYSALFLLPLVLLVGLIRKRWRDTAVVAIVAMAFVALLYSPELLRWRQTGLLRPRLGLRTATSRVLFFFAQRLGLPALSYFLGLESLAEHNLEGHQTYILGRVLDAGVWYYFPVAFLVKTPLATLAAIAGGVVLLYRQRKTNAFLALALAVPPVVFFALCMQSRIAIGHRHLLPVYPFLFVIAGWSLSRWRWAGFALVALLAVESLGIYPHYLAFFNQAAGGPVNGPKYLVDSNIDWGQDIKKLGRFMKQRQIPSVCLCVFGNVDLARYGVVSIDFPDRREDCHQFAAISVTPLYGVYNSRPDDYRFLRELQPIERVGYSIYVYDLRPRDASQERARPKMGE